MRAILFLRHKLYDWGWLRSYSFDSTTVICVGNITVGGTGKTPMVEYLLRHYLDRGLCPAVLSRGYGRKTKGFRYVAVGGAAWEYGDEPLQIKRKFPQVVVAVDKHREEGIRRLKAETSCNVIILDDAFQYRRLRAGYNLLLEDYARPIAKDRLLPWGRLRDLPSAAARAQAVVVTKCPPTLAVETLPKVSAYGVPQYYATLAYEPVAVPAGAPVLLVTGIARPQPLVAYVAQHFDLQQHLCFPDHHPFTSGDLLTIDRLLQAHPTWVLLCTEKDRTRLGRGIPVPVRVQFLSTPPEFPAGQ